MVKPHMDSDKDQSGATVEEVEASKLFANQGSPEIQATRSSFIWKGADAHRGQPKLDPNSDDMMRFTATGRPYVPDNRYQATWQGMANEDCPQGVTGKTLPWKYTDESLISVPCLKPRPEESADASGEVNDKKKKWWRRKSSTSSNSINDPNNFVLRKVKRGDYLKHYAKDEQGNYIGTEEPADDCILRGKDLEKYRNSRKTTFRNEIAGKMNRPAPVVGRSFDAEAFMAG
jgi:hypothetical protein